MKIRIKEHDLVILDRGFSKDHGVDRYLVVVDDTDRNITDGSKGGITDYGRQVVSYLMDIEAIKHGASQVVPASTCVIGGDVSKYSDDNTVTFNKGEAVFFIEPQLGKLLLDKDVAEELTEW